MTKQLLKLKVKIYNQLIKNDKLKLPISKSIFIEICKRLTKENNYNTYTKTLVCHKMWSLIHVKDINKSWGYNIDNDYFDDLYNHMIENKYIILINFSGDEFKINHVNINKNFWNKLVPVILSTTTTLLVNYILSLIVKK